MNGHWLSGTRKLNKHYQSGQGGGDITLTGMTLPIMGFEYGDFGERYPSGYGFKSADAENVITAQMYRMFTNGFPTQYTLEPSVHALYARWTISANGFTAPTSGRWSADVPIWRYGEFSGEPYWSYQDANGTEATWGEPTDDDSEVNQNGINYRTQLASTSRYIKNTSQSLETVYNGKTVHVVIPIFEVVALPSTGYDNYTEGVILSNGSFDDHYENKIKLRGYKKGPKRVWGTQYGNAVTYWFKATDGNIYRGPAGPIEIYGLTDFGGFWGDLMYKPIIREIIDQSDPDYGDHVVSAGTYTDPDTGNTYNMIYYVRLARLEQADYVLPSRILPIVVTGES